MTHSRTPLVPAAGGLYAAKPAFQRLLAGTANTLAARGVHPDALTYAAVGCGMLGGAVLVVGAAQPVFLWCLPALAAIRLTLNALDGLVAQRRGLARAWGKVLNELGDRLADLAFFGPLLLVAGVHPLLTSAALCAMLLTSHLGVLAEAAGASRLYGGVMGKADRMLWLSLAAVITGLTGELLALQVLPLVLLAGAGLTLAQRGGQARAAL